jgi:membrane carboxypeptidase/penicillin-binding protein PbpC
MWFLNGALVEGDRAERLVLGTGTYELRCVDPAGASSAVRFAVR